VLSFFPANKFDVQEVLQLHRFGTWSENRLFYRNQIASLRLASIALVSKQIAGCIGRNVGVLPTFFHALCLARVCSPGFTKPENPGNPA
jgi:hypothetical protein